MTDREAIQALICLYLNERKPVEIPMERFGWDDAAVLAVGFLILITPAIVFYFWGI